MAPSGQTSFPRGIPVSLVEENHQPESLTAGEGFEGGEGDGRAGSRLSTNPGNKFLHQAGAERLLLWTGHLYIFVPPQASQKDLHHILANQRVPLPSKLKENVLICASLTFLIS